MEKRYNGGPAFPITVEPSLKLMQPEQRHLGISKLEYFAAYAPMPIPDWFKHEPSAPMPKIPDMNGSNAQEHFAAKAEQEAWKKEQQCAKFFAWRWYYAKMMLATEASE